MRLRNKVAVVTGASQGLGQHLAVDLAKEGAQVVLAARNKERLNDVAATITALGGRAITVAADLCDEGNCRELIETTRKHLGPVEILILNAGSATYGRLDELPTLAPLREALQVNLFGAAMPTFFALDDLVERKGLIGYVTSGAGHLPMAGYLGYTTSKNAMNGFFEALRLELWPHGVDVLTINPGDMYSDYGAGRTIVGPDGHQYKTDLSVYRRHDIPRRPASHVAQRCIEAIVQRRREVDESPRIQKVGTKLRAFAPEFVDRRIQHKAITMRSAFDTIANDEHRKQHLVNDPDCLSCQRASPSPRH